MTQSGLLAQNDEVVCTLGVSIMELRMQARDSWRCTVHAVLQSALSLNENSSVTCLLICFTGATELRDVAAR